MDGVFDLDPALFEQIGQVSHGVLRLAHGHAVAGDHDHASGRVKQQRDFLGRGRLNLTGIDLVVAGSACDLGTDAAEEHIAQRAVHGPAHDLRQNQPRGPHQRPRDNQHVVVEHKASSSRGQARTRIEQGNHHRHIGSAYGYHEQQAQQRSHADHSPKGVRLAQHQPSTQARAAEG